MLYKEGHGVGMELLKNDSTESLVSVVIPCYNVEQKIPKLLESLQKQTYKNLELIFVDDGSIDNTKEAILHAFTIFEKMGMRTEYIYQENRGPGGAINAGIKKITGDYLIWPDADDWLNDDSIERRLLFMEKNPEYGVVSSNAAIFLSEDITKPIGKIRRKSGIRNERKEWQFERLIRYKSIFCPGCHMIRVSMLKKVNPVLDIYEGVRGQNFQMLMPMYYSYKRYFMNECLYNYVIYSDSVSHGDDSFDKYKKRRTELMDIIMHTLSRIDMSEKERECYKEIVIRDNLVNLFKKAMFFAQKKEMSDLRKEIRNRKIRNVKVEMMWLLGRNKMIWKLLNEARHIKRNV